jgi:protein-S-isoprenylcysteine O-methyltransferase Ste14
MSAAPSYSRTRFPGFYFLLQGLAISAWWVWLWTSPAARVRFVPAGAGEPDLLAFAMPDFLVVGFSLAAAVAFFRDTRWLLPLAWFAAGGTAYSAAYCVGWSMLRGGAWISVLAMAPAALLAGVAALDASPQAISVFRRSTGTGRHRHRLATLVQIVLFWSFFLLVVPKILTAFEERLGWGSFDFPGRLACGVVLLVTASALGLWSGLTLSTHGDGTPLPFDATHRLVLAGPYGFVRNPMVVAGLAQGMAVALIFGSGIVAIYVVLGGLIWQCLVRPAEEEDMRLQFGEDYDRYRAAVRCWWPRQRRFLPAAGP